MLPGRLRSHHRAAAAQRLCQRVAPLPGLLPAGLWRHGGLSARGCPPGGSALLLVAWLALVGALALACFVRAVGIGFLGRPRSRKAERAREGSRGMVAAQVGLAVTCAILGLAAPALLRLLGPAVG